MTFRVAFTRPHSDAEQDVFWASLYERLGAIPGVLAAAGGNVPTFNQIPVSGLDIEGRLVERGRLPDTRYTAVSDQYFAALRVPILRGRAFDAGDRAGAQPVAIVSAALARQQWPDGDPIGARVKPDGGKPWATIVGIAGDVRMGGAEAAQPTVYTSQRQDHWPGGGTVVMRMGRDATVAARSIRDVVKGVDPTVPVIGLRTLEDIRRSSPAVAERRLQLQLFAVFALAALAVAATGIYGVSAYAMVARRREFGIRLVLGASRRHVLASALRDAMTIAALGTIAGVPLAWLLASRMRGLLYEITPFDPVAATAAVAALVAVTLAASLMPARRATLIDPARTMRTD